jgi:hypothetical protein
VRPSARAAVLAVPAALILALPGVAHAETPPPPPPAASGTVDGWVAALRDYFRHHPSTRPTALQAVPPPPPADPPTPPRDTAARA